MNAESPLFGLSIRQRPANSQAEQALLGAILANNRAYQEVADFLRPEHFDDPVHAAIYEAIETCVAEGKYADAVTLMGRFQNTGELDEAGGAEYLSQLITANISGVSGAKAYGQAIIGAWKRRQAIAAGEAIINSAVKSLPTVTPISRRIVTP
jgi:replicative DNA helicase